MRKLFLAAILVFATIIGARAQFYLAGDDPGHLKWNYIRTPNYKVIYPRGLDSLAVVYVRALETNRPRVALSAGYLPGQTYWGATPVVLHAYTPYSNGSVAWAPMRMDLYTLPEAYGPETMPWVQELAIHENRHVAQLQFGADGILKPFTWIFGEAATGLFAGIYPSYWLAEGDAVAAETALSGFGRGRSSDFMAYYMTAFDKGDYRNWEKWRWGSWKRYAPNHYALGYMTVAGGRYLYNDPLFTADYLHLAANRPLKPTKVRAWFKDRSGKSFDAALRARTFDPDGPNYTPRISGILHFEEDTFSYEMNILKSNGGDPSSCNRYNFFYDNPKIEKAIEKTEQQVLAGQIDSFMAAEQLIDLYREEEKK